MDNKNRHDLFEEAGLDYLGCIQEILSQVRAGKLNKPQLQAITEGKNPFDFICLDEAKKLLGKDHTISKDEAIQVWNQFLEDGEPIINYYKATIQELTTQNQQGRANWHLIYINGLSQRTQQEILGIKPEKKYSAGSIHFSPNIENASWEDFAPSRGYYLINLKPEFGGLNWAQQECKIKNMKRVNRCHETIFSEAIYSIFKVHQRVVTKNKEFRNGCWFHWGYHQYRSGYEYGPILISMDDVNGIPTISASYQLNNMSNWLVALERKKDF